MAGIVLDSSIVIALFKPTDKHHGAVKESVAAVEERLMISTITLTEVLVRPAQLSQKEAASKAGFLRDYFGLAIAVTSDVAELAAAVRASTGLTIPDAIISATATVNMAALWTCDARLAKLHKGAHLIT